ncbi:hypothetical protein [Streptomyces sp. NPDC001658]
MRRPAQQQYGPAARTAWAHPYRGIRGLEVFYNDGGQGGTPAAPSPADLAARTAPPAPAPAPVAPVPPTGQEPLIDKDTGLAMTQDRFTKIMKRQYDKSRNAAYRELAESAGLPFDPDTFDPTAFAQLLKDAKETRQAQMSEEQRRAEELATREKELQARLEAAAQREKDAADRDRASKVRAALVSRGATGDDLDDAAALLRVADDADDTAIQEAADKLKERRSELFGAHPVPQTLPPAPSGGPAGGNAPRHPTPGKDAVKEAARARAEAMGLRRSDAA